MKIQNNRGLWIVFATLTLTSLLLFYVAFALIGLDGPVWHVAVLIAIIGAILFVLPWFLFFATPMRGAWRIVTIDDRGIRTTLFSKEHGFIPWEAVHDLGIGFAKGRYGDVPWIYFATKPLDEREKMHMDKIGQDAHGVRIRYTSQNLAIVKKYCPIERMHRLDKA